jgi:hypothetical protein
MGEIQSDGGRRPPGDKAALALSALPNPLRKLQYYQPDLDINSVDFHSERSALAGRMPSRVFRAPTRIGRSIELTIPDDSQIEVEYKGNHFALDFRSSQDGNGTAYHLTVSKLSGPTMNLSPFGDLSGRGHR